MISTGNPAFSLDSRPARCSVVFRPSLSRLATSGRVWRSALGWGLGFSIALNLLQSAQAQPAKIPPGDPPAGMPAANPPAELPSANRAAELPSANRVYQPLPLTAGKAVKDSLSEKDIPTGKGSFARDYWVSLQKGDQIAIDLTSENFDAVVTLMTPNGNTMGENDDGPDGSTNALLFMRIDQTGSYIVRVQAFGQAKGGQFNLKLTRLQPAGDR